MATSIQDTLLEIGKRAKKSAARLALATREQKVEALYAIGDAIQKSADEILAANRLDVSTSRRFEASPAFIDRLSINDARIKSMIKGLHSIAEQPDPVGKTLATMERPNGLRIERISVPIGVIGVIYESRPNVTVDAAGLCLMSGNAVILRGGSESFQTSAALVNAIHNGLRMSELPEDCVQMIPTPDRLAITEMLKLDQYIDVIVPRGGPRLIERISAESRIPLFKHLAGLCHTYIHKEADKEMALNILLNAKMRRPGICGATETLLIDEKIAASFLPDIFQKLQEVGCEIRAEHPIAIQYPNIKTANLEDFDTEYLDAIISVKVVPGIDTAIQHIQKHGTQHTEAIITNNMEAANKFMREIDSAIVMHNTSTQFADGGEFGMGAEIGIATGKLHARGPVGVEQLTTFKYLVHGSGQIRP